MSTWTRFPVAFLAVFLLGVASPGCGWQSGEDDALGAGGPTGLVARRGTVLVDGCALTSGESAALASPALKKLAQDVIFLCFTLDTTGAAQPSDAPSRAAFGLVVGQVRAMGYSVKVGVSLSGDAGGMYDATTTASLFASANWIRAVVANASSVASLGDGLDLDFQRVPDSERDALTALVTSIAGVVRPGRPLELFVPPSVAVPSDLPDGDAFDVPALGGAVDRLRVMTLDYSTGTAGGPTIDAGWAVDAASLAESETRVPVDVAFPLYGWDFSDGTAAAVTFGQAESLAEAHAASIARSLGGDLSFGYEDDKGALHEVWFDDAQATLRTLTAWSPSALSPSVGVLFYGLGDEDPSTWSILQEATQP